MKGKSFGGTTLTLFLCLLAGILSFGAAPASAGTTQLGPRTSYSADQIADAVRNSNLNSSLMADADQMGNLGVFESGGNAGIRNSTCCTGIFQLNGTNLRAAGLTPQQYANMSLQEQTNVWADLTNKGYNAVPSALRGGGTFDGQPVDGAMRMACIQLGTGNCAKMVRSGSCNGWADSNGTTICKMADKIRNGKASKGGGGGCQTPSDSGKEKGSEVVPSPPATATPSDGSSGSTTTGGGSTGGTDTPAGNAAAAKNTTVPCKSATDGGGGSSGTCDANMTLQGGIQCSNFTGSLVAFCEQYKPKLMTRSDCDKAEKYAKDAKKGPREIECKNQTFGGRGTKAWSYVLACSGTPTNQGEKGNSTTPGSGKENGTKTPGEDGKDGSSGSSSGGSTPGSDGKGTSTGDGSSSGSGSGSTGTDRRSELSQYNGEFVGTNEQCVALSKQLGTDENGRPLGPASGWSQGTTINADNWQQYQGQAVATSNDDGMYSRNGGSTASQVAAGNGVYSHTGILTGWDSGRNAPILFDQAAGLPAGERTANVARYGSFSTIRQ